MHRVLAADDEAVSRLVLVRMLGGLDLDVAEASDVPEAIALLEDLPFELVVSDYRMPSGTGLDLAEVADRVGVPFILLTGVGGRDNLDDDRLDLVRAHLTKPVSSAELAQAVTAALSSGAGETLDPAVLGELTADLGDVTVTATIVQAFLDELETRCGELTSALTDGHHDRARRAAHTLAAPSATVGAVALANRCRAIEGQPEPATGQAHDIDELALAARRALRRWLEES